MLLKKEKNGINSRDINTEFKYASSGFDAATSKYLPFDPYSLSNLNTYFIPSNY